MDITEFYESFFEEAEELLDDMERYLLDLDLDDPDPEQLNAIFRAAHSIKGGAGAFGFTVLQETTHKLENLLDYARKGQLTLRSDIVDTFLETKDMLQDQLTAYREKVEPDAEAFERICKVLQQIALEEVEGGEAGAAITTQAPTPQPEPEPEPEPEAVGTEQGGCLSVALLGVSAKDRELLTDELGHLGRVIGSSGGDERFEVVLETTASADDVMAVMCFVIEPEQLEVTARAPVAAAGAADGAKAEKRAELEKEEARPVQAESTVKSEAKSPGTDPDANKGGKKKSSGKDKAAVDTSIRVPVNKVDQIINLVGELIITQSMLTQTATQLSGQNESLMGGINLLQRNARDLQEAVMSIRMVQMDYVFSRFPRLVRDISAKLGKQVELITEGKSTELDKGLIERIIDPLTHLVRNSMDHGIEMPDVREAAGKPAKGTLTLSAKHQGGNIVIEVIDDGAGLNREKLLAKARSNGLDVSDNMSDEDVWQLIFAPGFSTAEQVSDISGRGVGMDVVRRNIQSMGGHVEVLSRPGNGTTTRIVLPLTLAILDGMSVRVGSEMFILPLGVVNELLQPAKSELYRMAGDDVLLKVRDEYLPVVSLQEAMNVPGDSREMTDCIAVIVQGEGTRYALLIDEPVGQQQVVVKNLESNYRKVPGISAATILGDGRVALILDVADLHRHNHARRKKNSPFAKEQQHSLEVEPS